jgi:surface polysaccharide O-acyltransferase-like enzyme
MMGLWIVKLMRAMSFIMIAQMVKLGDSLSKSYYCCYYFHLLVFLLLDPNHFELEEIAIMIIPQLVWVLIF